MENDEAVCAGSDRRNLLRAHIRADRLEGRGNRAAIAGGGRSTAGADGSSMRGEPATAAAGVFDGAPGVVAGVLDSWVFDSRPGLVARALHGRPGVVTFLDCMPGVVAGILVGLLGGSCGLFQRPARGGIKSTLGVSTAGKNNRNQQDE